MRRQYSTAPAGPEREHARADGGDRDLGEEDDREDGDEDGGDGAPLEGLLDAPREHLAGHDDGGDERDPPAPRSPLRALARLTHRVTQA